MKHMTKRNLANIRRRFQEQTGVKLDCAKRPRISGGRLCVAAAVMICCLALAAFGYPLFSGLDGDELSLSGTYEGNGIVSVRVENRSDKWLCFQKQTKLIRWVTAEEVTRLEGPVTFRNTEFAPHSEGTMYLDLSEGYDISALEHSPTNGEWFYLVLTNNQFLFGQDWMCSVRFAPVKEETPETAESKSSAAEEEILSGIEEELRFYFEESYTGALMAFNEANFQYQQKVDELLARFEGTVVPTLGPTLMVGGPSEFLDPEPVLGKPPEGALFDESLPPEQQYLLVGSDWTFTDACGRMVATVEEKAWAQAAVLPQQPGQTDGGVTIPLVFLFVYDAQQARPENYAFIYGQLCSFGELEAYKVLEDEHYAVYDATDLIYRDLDAYLEYFVSARKDVYWDEGVRQRVHRISEYYRDRENLRQMYGYLTFPEK